MKAFFGALAAIVIWLPCTVVGWGAGMSMGDGVQYALVATAIPLAALAIVYGVARALKWAEFATAFAITGAILVVLCGLCNGLSIQSGNRPPRLGGQKNELSVIRPS